ncbi:hypothetical protein [Krasilnikoviella flava]|uniref:hypothetical protein n=1 Tax=Krasilnikoviella flava TaxID=526729 RepID=UPI0009A6BFB9|nr:hypothetical protein [Krasilnikoviella flava]
MTSGPDEEAEAFAHAVRNATADGNSKALAELRALGDYPGDEPLTVERIIVYRRWAQHHGS